MAGRRQRSQFAEIRQDVRRSQAEAWQGFRRWLRVGPAVIQAAVAAVAVVLFAVVFWQTNLRPRQARDYLPIVVTAMVVGGVPLAIRIWTPRARYEGRSLAQRPDQENAPLDRNWPAVAMYFTLVVALAGLIWGLIRDSEPLRLVYVLAALASAQFAWQRTKTLDGRPSRTRRLTSALLALAAFTAGPLVAQIAVGAIHLPPGVWRSIATAGAILLLLASWQAFRIFRAAAASRFWLSWLVAFLLVAPAAFTAVGQMDALLAGRHLDGQASFGLRSLITRDSTAATDAVVAWRLHAADIGPQQLAEGDEVVRLAVLFDTVLLAPAVAGIFFLLLYRMRRRLQDLSRPPFSGPDERRRLEALQLRRRYPGRSSKPTAQEWKAFDRSVEDHKLMARLGADLAVLLLVVDWAENMAMVSLVSYLWAPLESLTPEQITSGLGRGTRAGWIVWTLLVMSTLKLVLLAVLVILTIAVAAYLGRFYRPEVKEVLQGALLLRGQIVVMACLAAALFLHEQVPDVLRGWDDDHLLLLTGIGLMMWLGLASCLMARHLLWRDPARQPADLSLPRAFLTASATLVVGLLAGWLFDISGLWLPGALLVVTVIVSMAARETSLVERTPWGTGKVALPGLLAVTPTVLLGLAMLRGAIGVAVHQRRFETDWESEGILIVTGTALLVSAPAIYNLLNRGFGERFKGFRRAAPTPGGLRALLTFHAVAAVVLYRTLLSDRFWGFTYAVGTVGVLALFLTFVSLVLGSLILLSEHWQPLPAFRLLRLRLTPVLSLILVWALASTVLAGESSYHDARLTAAEPPPRCELLQRPGASTGAQTGPVRVGDVLERWKLKNLRQPAAAAAQDEATAVPLVLVASSGGGIRAAYFTLVALQEIFDEASVDDACNASNRPATKADRILALSGVSGGSLGIASFAAQLADPRIKGASDMREVADHVGGRDYLSPTIAWWLFMDTPQVLLRMPLAKDRATILELAWERAWGPGSLLKTGLRQIWFDHPQVPLLLLNGTTVETGCRFNASVLDANVELPDPAGSGGTRRDIARACLSLEAFGSTTAPVGSPSFSATVHLADFLCEEDGQTDDIKLSTGALLSARFPGVSPSGGLPWHKRCRTKAEEKTAPTTFVVDGGYLDNSGASTALELWNALEDDVAGYNRSAEGTCIVPFFLQIDNGYEEAVGPGGLSKRPMEALAPFSTADATRNSRAASARQAAAMAFDGPYGFERGDRLWTVRRPDGRDLGTRYARLSLQAHPGARAPLGWALSDESKAELDRQVKQSKRNAAAIDAARQWLAAGELVCRPSGPAAPAR